MLVHHFGSVSSARHAAGLSDPVPPRKWSLELVIEEVRRLHNDGIWIRDHDLTQAGHADLVGAIREYAGGIVRVRRLANVPEPPRRVPAEIEIWDEARVVDEILDRHDDGEPLASSKVPGKLAAAAIRFYGSWANAIAAAGLDYDKIRLKRAPYTIDELRDGIRTLARTKPRMTLSEFRHATSLGPVAARYYRSIQDAIADAGVAGWPRRVKFRTISESAVIRGLRQRHRNGLSLLKSDIAHDNAALDAGIARHFATLERALTAAGLRPRRQFRTRESVLDDLRREARGKTILTSTQISDSLREVAARYYGSFQAALDAAGIKGLDRKQWSRDRVIEVLREHHQRHGDQESWRSVGQSALTAAWRYFGGLDAALEAAGIERRPAPRGR
jgi:hypothetical protein